MDPDFEILYENKPCDKKTQAPDKSSDQANKNIPKNEKSKNPTEHLKTVRKTQCMKLSQKMNKIKVNELPGEFGLLFPKKKVPAKDDVIEICDSADEDEPVSTAITAKGPKPVNSKPKPSVSTPNLSIPFLCQRPKTTNSVPVKTKTNKKLKLKLKTIRTKLKPGDKRPAVIDGMNILYFHPDQNKKNAPPQRLDFNNLLAVVDALQKAGYNSTNIFIVVQPYVLGDKVKNSLNFDCRKQVISLMRGSNTRSVRKTDPESDTKQVGDKAQALFGAVNQKFKPGKNTNRKKREQIESHDDLAAIDLAKSKDGIIVTNDNYRDHVDDWISKQNFEMSDFIRNRSLNYRINDGRCVFPQDPLGKNRDICLEQFLTVQRKLKK